MVRRLSEFFQKHPKIKKVLTLAASIATSVALGPLSGIVGEGIRKSAEAIIKNLPEGTRDTAEKAYDALIERISEEEMTKKLLEFIKNAIEDGKLIEEIKKAIHEEGLELAMQINEALLQLEYTISEKFEKIDSIRNDILGISRQLGIIQELVSYFYTPESKERVLAIWRLPRYIDNVLTIDETRRKALETALKHAKNSENVVIIGDPGVGKTVLLYALWRELEKTHNVAILHDTRNLGTLHKKWGYILFYDDLPESKELAEAIGEYGIKGVVTTARKQEWENIPSKQGIYSKE